MEMGFPQREYGSLTLFSGPLPLFFYRVPRESLDPPDNRVIPVLR